MNIDRSAPPRDLDPEFAELVETLHQAGQRLEELTAGEVDGVADRGGRTFLLLSAQERLRFSEAAKQSAILDALPAHIALLDAQGRIVSVNQQWRRFAFAHAIQSPGYGVGVNYVDVCDRASGAGLSHARQIAQGIRSVLDGSIERFSIEYPCSSPTEERWFLLTVVPLTDSRSSGVIVMHVDVTLQRQMNERLHVGELRFRQMAENIRDVFFLFEADRSSLLYVSPAYEDVWLQSCASLYANPDSWAQSIHPEDQSAVYEHYRGEMSGRTLEIEYRIVRPNGDIRWITARTFPVRDAAGSVVRIAGVAADITERKKAAQELSESERRFSDLLRNVELASLMLDRDARITYCNDYLLRLTGWRREEVIGQDWFARFVPREATLTHAVFAALLANQPEASHHENEILTRSGERRLIRWNNSLLRSGSGEVIGCASIGQDITEQKRAEIRIKRLNRVHTLVSGINSLMARVRDRGELFRGACQMAVEHGHFKMAWVGIVDREAMRIVPAASAGVEPEFVALIKDRLALHDATPLSGNGSTARAVREKKGIVTNEIDGDTTIFFEAERIERGIFSMAVLPLLVADNAVGVLALYADENDFFDDEEMKLLTELASDIAFGIDHLEKQERLDYLAYYDVLTGLANRSLFLERVASYIHGAAGGDHKLAIYLVDLEGFKNINDSLGQTAGDSLLKQVAAWLTRAMGDANRLARVSGDRFAVVLPNVNQEGDVARLLDRTIEAFLEHPFRLNDGIFRIAAKVGIALFPNDGADADTLLKNAEAALKKAKLSGDRYLFYTQKMTEAVALRLTLETQLRHALRYEEFVLHYQPTVNLSTGKVMGAEALIRWNDPRTGLVAPDRFIPILEEMRLIHEVGRWALGKAIADYRRWRAAGLPAVRIAVNVSPLQLRNRNFVAEIQDIVRNTPEAAAGLELEITESLIMEDVDHSVLSLLAIRELGIHIAIDDFGTGYSSLSYLSKLPVDTLKIDRSFIVDMLSGEDGLALVSVIINLAHALKLNVVAEGVESAEQMLELQRLRCDEMQGFLCGKPVPSEIFEKTYLVRAAGD
jgi:diguanylate cyclase (GGDEF)-like protein/PAS domain S-box-containing protein